VFFLSGAGHGSWAPRLAEIKAHVGASDGQMGLALLMIAFGALLAMPTAGWLAARHGSRPVTAATALAHGLAFPLIAFASSPVSLGGAFFLYGFAVGALDVSMNVQAASVEARYGRPIMSSLHGVFSVGDIAGALGAGAAAYLALGLVPHLAIMTLPILFLGTGVCVLMLPRAAEPIHDGPAFARPGRSLMMLAMIGFIALLAEGSIGDWSAIYLHDYLGAETGTAALAFAAFAAAMATGRFAGDYLVKRFGAITMLRTAGLLATLGLALTLISPAAWLAILGYGIAGLGISVLFPIALSVAARTPGISPGIAIAGVSTVGYCGFLFGPPTIGLLADVTGLATALCLVVLLAALIMPMAGRAGERSAMPVTES
jgi:MFS family permease